MFKMGHSKNAYYIFVGTKVQQKNGICKFWRRFCQIWSKMIKT